MQKLSDKAYQNKLNYIAEYKKKYKQMLFQLEPEKDKELIDALTSTDNKVEYLRMLFKEHKERS